MTNKEAIEILTGRKVYGSSEPEKRIVEWDNAIYLAIKALEERPQGDLISRSELKKAITEATYNFEQIPIRVDKVQEIIDNAPTVEYTFEEAFQKTVCENKLYCPARPEGEWKETGYETGALGITYRQTQCSNCGWEHALPMWWNFCPNCGAKMRKGGADE